MEEYPKVSFRLFNATDGLLISLWITNQAYLTFFRHNAVMPSFEDCSRYPTWSNNIVMMVVDEAGSTIGMVNGYYANWRNRVIHAGILLTEEAQHRGYGHAAFAQWVFYLAERFGFRKIVAEIVEERLVKPMERFGFEVEGVYKSECLINGEYTDEYRLAYFGGI